MFDGHGFGFGMGGIFMWLFWLLVILTVVWLVKAFASGNHADRKEPPSAREILEQRLARGEIDEEEFERKLRALNH